MIDPALAVILAAIVGVFGGLGGALIVAASNARITREEAVRRSESARAERVRADRLAELDRTRRRLIGQLEWIVAMVVGDAAGLDHARGYQPDVFELTNIYLLRDVNLLREYQDVHAELSHRYGTTLTVEEQLRVAKLQNRVLVVLAEQQRLILADKEPEFMPENEAAVLLDADLFASRIAAFDRPPAIPGRIARLLMKGRERQLPPPDRNK